MNNIVILSVEDWEALYVNGVNVYENHMVEVEHLIEYCPIENIERTWVSEDILIRNSFPKMLPSDLTQYKL